MPKKFIPIVGGLIALYLIVVNSKGAAALIDSVTRGGANVARTLQGRG